MKYTLNSRITLFGGQTFYDDRGTKLIHFVDSLVSPLKKIKMKRERKDEI